MQKFWATVGRLEKLSDEGKHLLQDISTTKELKKGDLVLAEGEISRHLYFVEKGLLRIYYMKDGKDVTEWLALDHTFCLSIISFFEQTPSRLIIECIENSEIIFTSRDGLMNLSNTNLEIARIFRQLITGSLIFSQVRMESIQFETASQRYQRLLQQNPEILRRVPLMYIASFLGISFETLSRIRAQNH
jgi:CRP-like cAMP-binding protein